jgi:hypothetical protein
MIRKLTTALPLAIVLAAALTAPALAQTHHQRLVQPLRHIVSMSTHGSDMYAGDATQWRQGLRHFTNGAATVPWIDNPVSPGG